MLTDLFSRVLAMSLAGSAVIGVILLLRLLLGQGPKRYICLLWHGIPTADTSGGGAADFHGTGNVLRGNACP